MKIRRVFEILALFPLGVIVTVCVFIEDIVHVFFKE